jgi:ubiquinone biosynthesis protein
MAESEPTKRSRTRAKLRQQEVRHCLADFGLARSTCRLWQDRGPESPDVSHGRRVRQALTQLGPVFASFGRYLASRPDLLPAPYRVELAALSPGVRPLPVATVRAVIAQELGRSPAEVFPTLEEVPFEIGLLYQVHRARLSDGEPVTVKVLRPTGSDESATDLELLPLLAGLFAGEAWWGWILESALADFRNTVQQEADFVHEARVLEAAAGDAEDFDLLGVPRVHCELSTAQLLIVEALSGWQLANVFRPSGEMRPQGIAPGEVADRACKAWLWQALLGRYFPAEPSLHNITLLPDGRFVFGGPCASLPATTRKELWEYLLAAAMGDPDGACTHLFRIMEKRGRSADEDGLRHQFRQVAPFRDSEEAGDETEAGLKGYLQAHWRLAHAHGCRPPLHLVRFFRGLLLLEETLRGGAPRRDLLRDGFENVRVYGALARFGELLRLGEWDRSLEKYAPLLLELPRKMDEVLTLATEGSARMQLQVRETAEHRRHRNSTASVAALLLVLAGVALLTRYLAAAEELRGWEVSIGTATFVLVGTLLLGRFGGTR